MFAKREHSEVHKPLFRVRLLILREHVEAGKMLFFLVLIPDDSCQIVYIDRFHDILLVLLRTVLCMRLTNALA